jgi:tRNA uridine 5-carbamoylmethylation protein Kti12
MNKTIKIINRKDEDTLDISFWQSKSSEEKLTVLQELREQYIKLFNKQMEYNESRKRLRRVFKIIKRT